MKVLTIAGTRPELIKLARTIPSLDEACNHVFVHTGQNADPRLKDVFFNELKIREPDYYLDCDTSSLGATLADIFIKTERLLQSEQPDAVVILGDTNSALAAIIAKRMGVRVIHLEAGNRAFDDRVPEEINRRIVDSLADINCVYTEHARRNLLAEGHRPNSIYLSGSPMREVLDFYIEEIAGSQVLMDQDLKPQDYFLISLHRQENVDDPRRLASILDGVNAVSDRYELPIIATMHPRTRKQLTTDQRKNNSIRWCSPFGLFDYCALQINARCVISDSGTLSEESSILGFPAVSSRDSSERPEGLDAGGFVLAGLTPNALVDSVAHAIRSNNTNCPPEYEIDNFSHRITNIIMSAGLWQS